MNSEQKFNGHFIEKINFVVELKNVFPAKVKIVFKNLVALSKLEALLYLVGCLIYKNYLCLMIENNEILSVLNIKLN